MNITAAQRKALTLINENPGKVAAYVRNGIAASMLKVNGNVEWSLTRLGIAVAVDTDVELYRDEDGPRHLQCWEITELGRAALGLGTASPAVHPITGMTTYAVADYLRQHVDADTLTRIAADDMADLIDRLQRSGHVPDDRFRSLVAQAAGL